MDKLNWELIGIAIGIIASVLGGVWFIIQKAFGMGRFSSRVEEMDKRTCRASCEPHEKDIDMLKSDAKGLKNELVSISQALLAHGKDIDDLKADMQGLKRDMQDVKIDMAAIKSLLMMKYKDIAPAFSQKRSPRQLNETGLRLFEDIDGKTFLEKNRDFFFMKIDECKPNTALDVENAAYFACMAYTDNEIFNGLKNFVYNSPSYLIKAEDGTERKYDLTLPDICFVLSLPLRDQYLSAHPEIITK